MQWATRISVCVIAVSKSHEFLLKVRRLSSFISTTPTPLRRRVVIFFHDTSAVALRSSEVSVSLSVTKFFTNRQNFRKTPNAYDVSDDVIGIGRRISK